MYHSLEKVVAKSRRKNDVANKILHPLASRLSIYFSWIFINIGISANGATLIFFLFGLASTVFILGNTMTFILLSYLFYRLHIIVDVSDGEVARYNQTFSINGSYWDSMIHQLVYPLLFIGMTIAQFLIWDDPLFLILGSFGGIVVGLTMSVKNNYYKAMLFNNQEISQYQSKASRKQITLKHRLFVIVTELLNFEGLYIAYMVAFHYTNKMLMIAIFLFFIFVFALQSLVKFILLSYKGYYPAKS